MNLYVHFPFCRRKCAYCALLSRAGTSLAARAGYVQRLVDEVRTRATAAPVVFETVYFGGGTPALCDLRPLFDALRPHLAATVEFTVELHPQDATDAVFAMLRDGGVNRISLGVQSLDDAALMAMGRLHTADEAEAAFRRVRAAGFANAGVDLIAGWPGTDAAMWRQTLARVVDWGIDHASVYTLIREPNTQLDRFVRSGRVALPDDAAALAQVDAARDVLAAAGLMRYEVSNYARSGRVCRHNVAVWHGEDYWGLGEGAHGREGVRRTVGTRNGYSTETRDAASDALERALFAFRLPQEGLDLAEAVRRWPVLAARLPGWRRTLAAFVETGVARQLAPDRFALTGRGLEVCDAVLAELI